MAKFKMIVLSSPVPGEEARFNDWYQNTHIPEVLTVPGMQGAQRYRLFAKLLGSGSNEWLTIYDIESDDPAALPAAMNEASTSGKRTRSDSLNISTAYSALFSEFGEFISSSG